ncbi:MAG: hypothetical protein F6K30_14490 [Cyanothece sp. SIO2G6]|nr:hypothetical protein [Cyanothece sp. SIO2G6]
MEEQRSKRLSQLAEMYQTLPEGRRQILENRIRITYEVRMTVAGLVAFIFGVYLTTQGVSWWGIPMAAWGILQWVDKYMQQETLSTVKAFLERNKKSKKNQTLPEGSKGGENSDNE